MKTFPNLKIAMITTSMLFSMSTQAKPTQNINCSFTEPFYGVDIDLQKMRALVSGIDGNDLKIVEVQESTDDKLTVKLEGESLSVDFTKEGSDGMSEFKFPYTGYYDLDGSTVEGGCHPSQASKPSKKFGEFQKPKQLSFLTNSAEDCADWNGKYDPKDLTCIYSGADVIEYRGINGQNVVEIFGAGPRGAMCMFTSQDVKRMWNGDVVASMKSYAYPGGPSETFECTVRLKFSKSNSVVSSVATKSCEQLCGNGASLDVSGAKRVLN